MLAEHVVNDHQDGVCDCDHGNLGPSSGSNASIESGEIGLLAMSRRVGCFHQEFTQPGTAFACLAAEPFARAFMVAGTHASPRGQVTSCGKARQVASDLS